MADNLKLNNYVCWANAHVGSRSNAAVALSSGSSDLGLSDIRTTTSAAERFFGKQNYRNQQEAVREDFKKALSERYGNIVAEATMKSVVGRSLTAKVIRRAVAFAEETAVRSMLTPDNDRCFRLTDGTLTITQETISGMPQEVRRVLNKFLTLQNKANGLLGNLPIGKPAVAAHKGETESVLKQFKELRPTFQFLAKTFESAGVLREDVKRLADHCREMAEQLNAHLESVHTLNANGPLSERRVADYRRMWSDVMANVCNRLLNERLAGAQMPVGVRKEDVQEVLERLKADTKEAAEGAGFELRTNQDEFLGRIIDVAIRDACGGWSPFSVDDLRRELKREYVRLVNARPWEPIKTTFDGTLNGQTFKLTSDIVPGKHLAGVGEGYPKGVNGYMCFNSDEAHHAVNLAETRLTVDDGKDGPHVVFSGIRHGVHSAWGVDGDEARRNANKERATDAVKAAFGAYLRQHPEIAEGSNVELPMVSVSLLTPDVIRPILASVKKNHNSDERRMLDDQLTAWQDVGEKAIEVKIDGKTYHVKPKVIPFNFAVNEGGVKWYSFATGGWGKTAPLNMSSLSALSEMAKTFVNDTTMPLKKRLAVQKLHNQLRDILKGAKEQADNHDAYKAAARVAVLFSLMGGVPCWNCKSGKDRTSEMDVECKFLATLIDRGLDIPEPGAKLTKEQSALFRSIALQGGSIELQEYNTGIGGYKTGSVPSIQERLGGSDVRQYHEGGSGYTLS